MRTHILLCRNYPYCLNATFHLEIECDRDCNHAPTLCMACQENDDPDPHAIDIDIGTASVTNFDIDDDRTDQDNAHDEDDVAGEANATSPESQQDEQHPTPRLRGGDGDGNSEDEGYADSASSLPSASSEEDDSTYSDGSEASNVEYFEEEEEEAEEERHYCPHCLAASRAAFEAHVRQVCNLLVRHGRTEFADVQAADVVADIRRRWERNAETAWRERERRRERHAQYLLTREREARARQGEHRGLVDYGEYEYEAEGGDEVDWGDDDEVREDWDGEDDGEVMVFVIDDDYEEAEIADLEEGRRRGMARLRG
ncbi:hypothetical protein HDK90DRAFT_104749 [Phyllosticta capitalensis]|uniref:Uncharacterized protein n=1 Tax=Phyllosticta capitalensis TaxID=121624 RepID=A0ABR1YBK0_9PEZI